MPSSLQIGDEFAMNFEGGVRPFFDFLFSEPFRELGANFGENVPSPSVGTKLHQPGPMGLAYGGVTILAGGITCFLCTIYEIPCSVHKKAAHV